MADKDRLRRQNAKLKARVAELEKTLGGGCLVFDRACADHGFFHGAEASELREGIEKLVKRFDPDGQHLSNGEAQDLLEDLCGDLQKLLESVDARDSLARLESQLPKGK